MGQPRVDAVDEPVERGLELHGLLGGAAGHGAVDLRLELGLGIRDLSGVAGQDVEDLGDSSGCQLDHAGTPENTRELGDGKATLGNGPPRAERGVGFGVAVDVGDAELVPEDLNTFAGSLRGLDVLVLHAEVGVLVVATQWVVGAAENAGGHGIVDVVVHRALVVPIVRRDAVDVAVARGHDRPRLGGALGGNGIRGLGWPLGNRDTRRGQRRDGDDENTAGHHTPHAAATTVSAHLRALGHVHGCPLLVARVRVAHVGEGRHSTQCD